MIRGNGGRKGSGFECPARASGMGGVTIKLPQDERSRVCGSHPTTNQQQMLTHPGRASWRSLDWEASPPLGFGQRNRKKRKLPPREKISLEATFPSPFSPHAGSCY